MDRNWTSLKQVLRRYQNQDITILDHGGNNGDHLINLGLERLVQDMNLVYNRFTPQEWGGHSYRWKIQTRLHRYVDRILVNPLNIDRPDVVYLQGGGNFNEFFDNGLRLFQIVLHSYPDTPVIVGPQTIWTQDGRLEDILKGTNQSIDLFCREFYSYAHLTNNLDLPGNVKIHLAPDTALYLDSSDLEPFIETSHQEIECNTEYDLLCFRRDNMGIVAEDTRKDLRNSSTNVIEQDVSNHYEFSFEEFVTLTHYANRVFTDRMHGALLGYVLGKAVFMYEVPFFKNTAAYRYHFRNTDSVQLRSSC